MLSIQTIKYECFTSTYAKGKELFDQGAVHAQIVESKDFLDDREFIVRGKVQGSGRKQYEVEVYVTEDDMIAGYECECPAYESYWGMCKHCVAAALFYRDAQQSARKNKSQKQIVRKSVKNTSESLKNVISGYAVRGKSYAMDGFYKNVDLIPEFHEQYNGYAVEFKIGAERKYVLKNVCKLLSDVENAAWAEYGKNLKFTHDRSAFTEEALIWLDTMADIMRTQYPSINFSTEIFSSNFRQISLLKYGMEKCIEIYIGKEMVIDGKTYHVKDQNPQIPVKISGDENGDGVDITAKMIKPIYGVNARYLIMDSDIYKCSKDFVRNIWPVLTAINIVSREGYTFYERTGNVYLNKEDYAAFCGNVLPVMEKYLKVDIQNVDFEPYQPQEAEFNVYLDVDAMDNSVITVRTEAIYGNKIYDLFGQKNLESEYRDLEKEQMLENCIRQYFRFDNHGINMYYANSDHASVNNENGEPTAPRINTMIGYCKNESDVFRLLQEGIGQIQSLAVVYVDERLRNVRVVKSPKVNMGIGIKNDLLQMDMQIEDVDMNEIMKILSAYRRHKKYYRLKNGDFVSLEDNGLSVVSELVSGLGLGEEDLQNGQMTVPEYRVGYVSEIVKNAPEGVSVERNMDFKKLVREMKSYEDSDFEVPKTLQAELRNYQKDGFRWMATLDAWGFGGILADDMGLGKTLQVITLLELKKETALIVSPASLVYNWESEIKKFAPDAQAQVIDGSSEERKHIIEQICNVDSTNNDSINNDTTSVKSAKIWITSYDLLKRDIKLYENVSFNLLVIDEAQYIKNAATQAAKAVKKIHARCRFALTGTPIENRLSDLWSIFDFIMPGYLYDYNKFKDELEKAIVQSNDEMAMKRLKLLVSPFILRRKKMDVLKDLPEKLEEIKYTRMVGEQKRLYDAHVAKLKMELAQQSDEEFKNNQIKLLAELTKLRMLCCAPSLCYENYGAESCKTDMCLELLDNTIAGNHKVLVFSQFTQMLDILAHALEKKGIQYLYLSGKNTKEQRKKMVEKFQNGDIPVFFISLKAGGTGLNLTAADVVIHYDPWWNMAAQNQATDRTHRIGQKNVVNVMRLVTKDTIEERIVELQQKKAALADSVIEGKGMDDHRLSRQELFDLLDR